MLARMATAPPTPPAPPHQVTQLLGAWRGGDERALADLTPLIYRQLHRLARGAMRGERAGHTLQATALVHEAFIGLAGAKVDWVDRAHFFAIAAQQMRRILVNHAQARRAAKRGGGAEHLPLDEALAVPGSPSAEISDVDDALRRLAALDERKARVLEMHYFAGMTYAEIAAVLDVSATTVETDLRFAKAWLRDRLQPSG